MTYLSYIAVGAVAVVLLMGGVVLFIVLAIPLILIPPWIISCALAN